MGGCASRDVHVSDGQMMNTAFLKYNFDCMLSGQGWAALSLFVGLFLFCGHVHAQDDDGFVIDIEEMNRRERQVVAIPEFTGGGLAGEAHEVVQNDMRMSGLFKEADPSSYEFFAKTDAGFTPATISFTNWSMTGAYLLIKGRVVGGKLEIRAFLVDASSELKVKWSAQAVDRKSVRKAAHEFVNALLERLTGKRGVFGTPIAFSARGKKGEKHVFVMDSDGANVFRVSKNTSINMLPRMTKAGVYYTSYVDDNPDLYLWSGGSSRKVSNKPGINNGGAYCGGKLAVTLSMGGTNVDIYLINPGSGGIIKRLTSHWSIDTSPSWSPDCSQIAFNSDRSGSPQVWIMDAAGGGKKQLTHQGKYNTTPDWSPEGDVIAFTGQDKGSDIFTVDLGGHITRLTQNQGLNEHPSFSPDGRYIVFVSKRAGHGSRLYVMTADGEFQTMVTTRGSGYSTPSWGK